MGDFVWHRLSVDLNQRVRLPELVEFCELAEPESLSPENQCRLSAASISVFNDQLASKASSIADRCKVLSFQIIDIDIA
jgi:hypothetical protein